MEPQRVERGYRQIGYEVVVPAPVSDVWALVSDPSRHHEFDGSDTVQPQVTMPDILEVGAKFTVAMRQKGLGYRITSVVTAYEPERLFEWQHPQGHRWRYELEPAGDHTRVTEVWNYSYAFAAFMLQWFGFPRRNARSIHATLIRLRDHFA